MPGEKETEIDCFNQKIITVCRWSKWYHKVIASTRDMYTLPSNKAITTFSQPIISYWNITTRNTNF